MTFDKRIFPSNQKQIENQLRFLLTQGQLLGALFLMNHHPEKGNYILTSIIID